MRILLAGTSSGCGKTTASLLLMAALRERGLDVAPCKVGPDYIDTGFHELVCGRPSHNLDSFLIEPRDLPTLLSRPADITVIEGVILAATSGAVNVRLGGGGLRPLASVDPLAGAQMADTGWPEPLRDTGSTGGREPDLAHLRSVVGLVWRSVVMWMVLLALLTLARLLG